MRRQSIHDQCFEMLPWFVNGSASLEQRTLIENHAAECAACAAELQAQQQLQTQLRTGDSVMLAPQASWQKMSERLDLEEEAREAHAISNFGKRPAMRGWQLAAAGQAAVIVGLAAMLWWQTRSMHAQAVVDASPTATPRYETLTSNVDVPIASRASGAEFRVVFQRDVPIKEVNELLQTLPAQIVSGPTEAGVYLLVLPPSRSGTADELLTQLRSDHRVIFAEHLNLIEYQP